MAISKASVAAGLLGGGGGAAGTVAVVKYVASNQETNSEETNKQQLQEARKQITDWADGKGKCTIKIRKAGDSGRAKELENVDDKAILDSLFKFLKKDSSKAKAEEECKKTKDENGTTMHAELTLTKTVDNDWGITNSIIE